MGSSQSGNRGGRPTVESGLTLDLRQLMRKGLIRHGACSGSITWGDGHSDNGRASIGIETKLDHDGGCLRLKYSTTTASGEKRDHDYQIALTTMPQPFGGRRWFFICPQLGIRVTKLYLTGGEFTFASRQAHRLGYRSQRRTPYDQCLNTAFKLRGRLGSDGGIGDYIPKPKWMRWATYERRMKKIRRVERIATKHLAVCLERLTRRNPFTRNVV